MQRAQITGDEFSKQTKAVVLAIAVKIGVKVRGHRQAEGFSGAQRRSAKRALGDNVNQVGRALLPQPQQAPLCRQAQHEFLITRDWQPPHQYVGQIGPVHRLVVGVLAGTDELHLMSAGAQRFNCKAYGSGDTVDFRWIGFGDDGQLERMAVLIGRGHGAQCAPAA